MQIKTLTQGAMFVACLLFAQAPAQSALAQQPSQVSDPGAAARAAGSEGNRSSMRAIESTRNTREPARAQGDIDNAARAAVAKAGLSCDVTASANPGRTSARKPIYEVACATGPGYIVIDSDPAESFNCIVLKTQADRLRAEDPDADLGTQCALPANADAKTVYQGYAQAAGLSCTVAGGAWVGRLTDGAERYEIDCDGADGYWLEVPPSGTPIKTLSCLEVLNAGGTCAMTTAEEQAAVVQAKLAGTSAPACQVQQVRYLGANDNGSFYETKCAEGPGFIQRFAADGVYNQSYACAEASHIAGGCQLTDVSGVLGDIEARRDQQMAALGFACAKTDSRKIGQENGGAGREVVEFACSDRELGIVGFLPSQGVEQASAIDCLTLTARGLQCRFVDEAKIKSVIARMLQAADVACDISAFKVQGRMVATDGDVVEVKCASGESYYGDFPDDRVKAEKVMTCDEARRNGATCSL